MPDIIRAGTGQLAEHEEFSPGASYPANATGISRRSDLGRVDAAQVEIDAGSAVAHVASITSNNLVHVRVFSVASGNEIQDGNDLSSDTLRLSMYRL